MQDILHHNTSNGTRIIRKAIIWDKVYLPAGSGGFLKSSSVRRESSSIRSKSSSRLTFKRVSADFLRSNDEPIFQEGFFALICAFNNKFLCYMDEPNVRVYMKISEAKNKLVPKKKNSLIFGQEILILKHG